MAEQRAKITQLMPHLWLIDDLDEATCYVIEGKTHAMVIDTVNGWEDLNAIVRTLTQLPLIVVNTHGHVDHVCGNVYFDEAWVHPADLALGIEHLGYQKEFYEKNDLTPCPFRELSIGQVFDLGDLELEVVDLRGHTPGSIGLLDRKDRILFTGDAINTHLWMQLEESLPIAELLKMLQEVKAQYGSEFDYILHGHDKGLRKAAPVIDQLIKGCEELLAGKGENDPSYVFFEDQVCKQHPISDVEREVIVYQAHNIR